MPFTVQTFNKVIRKITKQSEKKLAKEMAQILNFGEISKELHRFRARSKDLVNTKFAQNYSASYHFASGLLNKLYQSVQNPFKSKFKSTDQLQVDSVFIHDYIRKWVALTKEYKELAKCANQWECLADSLVKPQDIYTTMLKHELLDFSQIPHSLEEDQYTSTESLMSDAMTSPSTTSLYQSHTVSRETALGLFEKVLDEMSDLLTDSLSRLQINLSESQQQEKKLNLKKKQND